MPVITSCADSVTSCIDVCCFWQQDAKKWAETFASNKTFTAIYWRSRSIGGVPHFSPWADIGKVKGFTVGVETVAGVQYFRLKVIIATRNTRALGAIIRDNKQNCTYATRNLVGVFNAALDRRLKLICYTQPQFYSKPVSSSTKPKSKQIESSQIMSKH